MTIKYTDNLFSTTYKDDYSDSDNYHKVLFNSARALQARELTQMQTIIQKEIERFGRNVFKEGASVNPGGMTLDTSYRFIKLDTSTNTLPNNLSTIVGDEFTGQSSGVKVKILEVVPAAGSDPATIYIQYTDTSAGVGGTTAITVNAGEDLVGVGSGETLTVQPANTVDNPATGSGTRLSLHSGDFFVQGHFVFFIKQSLIISKYSSTPTVVAGFIVNQSVVTANDNEALFDNQNATPNRSAPGADRYKITLELTTQDLVDSDQTFVFFARIVNGIVYEQSDTSNSYNKIVDLLALRTGEINGNFIAKPFVIKYDAHPTNDTLLQAKISPGVAYINGYRVNSPVPLIKDIAKAQNTTTLNNQVVAANYGNYVNVDTIVGVPNINVFQPRNLRNAVAYGGSTIGTCRVRAIEQDGGVYKLYLFEIVMNSGQSFRDVKSVGSSAGDYGNIILDGTIANLQDVSNNNLLFNLPENRPKSLSDISLEVQRRFTATLDPTGAATLSLTATGETFANTNNWLVAVDSSGAIINTTISGSGTQSASITGGPTTTNIEVIAKVNKSAGTIRTKTLVTTTLTSLVESDGTGNKFISLRKPDLFDIVRLRDSDSDGSNIINKFIIDNGQRDNFYAPSKLILKGGAIAPSGDVFVRFRYFTHGASGDFFGVNSYQGQVNYGDIPNHILADGSVVPLRDVLDFRPRKTDKDSDFAGGTARINELPDNTDLITVDAEHYLPRYDKLSISQDGTVNLQQGVSSLTPKFPETPSNSLELYRIRMNPFTIDATDMSTTSIENKGYTMSDIGKIESRLNQVEELATLSLLELDLKNLIVFDSSGADRTKAGFIVDNFVDQLASDVSNVEYKASIDPRDKLMRPTFKENNIGLAYDSDLSTNVIKRGDNIYLKYSESTYINQPQVSGFENINPFAVITNLGQMTLSPSSDDWRETVRLADRIIDGGQRLNPSQATLWNNWEWNWGGTDVNNLSAGTELGRSSSRRNNVRLGNGLQGTVTTTTVTRIVAGETIRQVVGDRVVDVALVPFMRSRKVYFKAQGLKPNSRMWAFFDSKSVDDWIKSEAFVRVSDNPVTYGTRYNTAVQHPDTPSTLFTDGEGTVTGSFFVPNTDTFKFRSGAREFKLLDISVPVEKDATSIGVALYQSSGVIETRQQDVLSTRTLNIQSSSTSATSNVSQIERNSDPLAQSFMVNEPNGVFVTKFDVYFKTKDSVVPVQMQLRPMVNGQPSSTQTISGSVVFVSPSAVNISNDATAATTFEFDEPIFLNSFTEYAVVFLAETTEYNMYVAETGQFVLNSTEKRITNQPYMGSLFKSQNGSTWDPDQTKDLMFKIYKAEFSTSGGSIILENAGTLIDQLPTDPILITTSSNIVEISHPSHGFEIGNTTQIYGFDSALTYGGVKGSSFLGSRTVIARDEHSYTFAIDSDAGIDGVLGGFGITAKTQMPFEVIVPHIQNIIPQSTNIGISGKFMTGKSTAGNEAAYVKDPSYYSLALQENNTFTSPRLVATDDNEIANLPANTKSATIRIDLNSFSPDVSPVIDMQRSSVWAIHNIIDNQVDSAGVDTPTTNVPLSFTLETDATGGSGVSKHITRQVTLAADAIGLKVLLAANRPSVSDFDVYYKAIGDAIQFSETPWTLVAKEIQLPSDENVSVYRDYTYLVGGGTGLTEPFTKFQLKIVMRSSNNAKVPTFKDLRVIALAI